MKSRTMVVITSVIVALVLLAGTCSAGFLAGRAFGAFPGLAQVEMPGFPTPGPGVGNTGTPQDLQALFLPFWQAWKVIHDKFVDQPVDDQALMRGAIKGMLEALGDEHSFYMEPDLFQKSTAELEGEEYEGIGAWVDTTQDYLTIIAPIHDSPAEKAGLRSNDKIIAIDGEDVTGIDGETVRQRVLGPKGSKVRLTIMREGVEPFDVEIVREKILVPTVQSKMLDGDVAYIRLFTFGASTASDLQQALKELLDQKPVGLILDLRYNAGGYLDSAIDVTSQFIGDGVVMYEVYGNGERTTYEAEKGGLATEIPLVVLINEGSASASEIVAGAIQDRGRAKLVGVTSYGKGSVQTHVPLENNQGAVSVTIARWVTPNERQINEVGLEPDYKVEITEDDAKAGVDSQLQKAIELLTQPSSALFWLDRLLEYGDLMPLMTW